MLERRSYAEGFGRDVLTSPSSRALLGTLGRAATEPRAGFEAGLGDLEDFRSTEVELFEVCCCFAGSPEKASIASLLVWFCAGEVERARFLLGSPVGCLWSELLDWGEEWTASITVSSGSESGISVKLSRAGSYAIEDRLRGGAEREVSLMFAVSGATTE